MRNVDTVDPLLEAASDEGRMLNIGGYLVPEQGSGLQAPLRLPFAARVQQVLIVVMVVGMALLVQQWSKSLYQLGLPLLVVSAFLQIAFGNIPPTAGVRRSLVLLAMTWVIVGVLVYVSVQIVPGLTQIGKTR